MSRFSLKQRLFVFFFCSGFCVLTYQIVWTRLAMAAYGVITPVLSTVVSVFMLGLALGSWWAGRWVVRRRVLARTSPLVLYAAAEGVIGLGAFAAPRLLRLGEIALRSMPTSDSAWYLAGAVACITLSLLPWCVAMGATFPLIIALGRETNAARDTPFSFLYAANVTGAMAGVLATVVILIEVLGFSRTLTVCGILNFMIAALALTSAPAAGGPGTRLGVPPRQTVPTRPGIYVFLFMTGLTALGLEIVWVRNFTRVLGTEVYSFSSLLFVYLAATGAGTALYRRHRRLNRVWTPTLLVPLLALAAILPIFVNDPRLWSWLSMTPERLRSALLALVSLFPFCAGLGYVTPLLLDRHFAEDPAGLGLAYAVNGVGCIMGPLLAGFLLLPWVGAKSAWLLLALPYALWPGLEGRDRWTRVARALRAGALATAAGVGLLSASYETALYSPGAWLARDHTATVIATGSGRDKILWANGCGLTALTPITKFMAHAPLACLPRPAKRGLVICFGMGTTYRSFLSWGVETVAVELIPRVRDAFPFFFEDWRRVLADPRGQIVIDDGRRFLQRTNQVFDVITIDPPPPIEAAGSSLLYSREFYQLAKRRMAPDGILAQWIPFLPSADEEALLRAGARTLGGVFPYVRSFRSVEGWGCHLLASERPIALPLPREVAERMPLNAREDLLEWNGGTTVEAYWGEFASKEFPFSALVPPGPGPLITDDQPYNEYHLFRRYVLPWISASSPRRRPRWSRARRSGPASPA